MSVAHLLQSAFDWRLWIRPSGRDDSRLRLEKRHHMHDSPNNDAERHLHRPCEPRSILFDGW